MGTAIDMAFDGATLAACPLSALVLSFAFNMRKPLSIGVFVRARFKTGLFRFPSGGPAHAAGLVDACLAS